MSTDAQKAAKVPSSSLISSSSSGGRSAPAHVLFASLHALSAWLSVKSLAFVKALDQHETDDFGDDIIVTNNGPRSAVALLHRSACAIHLLRSAMRTYRELRNDDERQKQRRRRRRISSSKKKRKSTVKVLDWVFLRNTQTNAHDAKSTLERANEALVTADAVLDADDFDLEYDEEGTSKMNLKALGTLAMCGVFGHANDEFKDGRYPTAKERQLMRRFVDAVASVGFGAALRLTAGKVWSLERERERNRAIQTVFVASRAVEREKRKQASKNLGLEGLATRFRSHNAANRNNDERKSNSGTRKDASSKTSKNDEILTPFNRWRKNGTNQTSTSTTKNLARSSSSKATKRKTSGGARKKDDEKDADWIERAKERLPRVAPVILIVAGFAL